MSFKTDQESLRKWFLETKREFPWRNQITPYKVWISEVMLQQTRADVVVDYFERWMQLFPTIQDLKNAPLESVLKAWEGLGYYSRARNIHKAAESLASHFPMDYSSLISIKGIGAYTADAILSFAFHEKVIAMDANVERVLSRYFALHDLKEIKKRAEGDLSPLHPFEIAEALIELGATVCKKKPECENCPLSKGCLAYKNGSIPQYPLAKKRKQTQEVFIEVQIYQYKELFGVNKKGKNELFQDLYLFHENRVSEEIFLEITAKSLFKKVVATATFYRFHLIANLIEIDQPIEGLEFLSLKECLKKSFSSGHKRILHQLVSMKENQECIP
jgi:A/G-specific adenine glycosylase